MKGMFNVNCSEISTKVSTFRKLLSVAIITVCIIGLSHTAFAQQSTDNSTTVVVSQPNSTDVETHADFPGGIDKFYSYILSNVKLDPTCIPGKKVLVQFVIDKDGKLCHARVRDHQLSKTMEAQLVKVFEDAPKWNPATQHDKQLKEHFICPVIFMPKADLMAKADLPTIQK